MVKHLFTEGTLPVPPNRPCALRLCRITFSEDIVPGGGVHSGGGGGITCRSPQKIVKKKILRISYENRTTPVISGSGNLPYCDDLRRPRRDAPAALQLTENSVTGSQEPVTDASRTFTIFHGLGANHPRSCPFLLSQHFILFYYKKMEYEPGSGNTRTLIGFLNVKK